MLRYYEKRTVDYASFEIELLHYLGEHSYPCAVPIAKKDGGYIGTYREKPFALFELLRGEHSDDLENYLQVAEVIGKLHALTLGYRPNDGLSRYIYGPEYCWSCVQKSAKRIKSGTEALERMGWMKKEIGHYEQQRPMATDERLHLFDALKLVILIGIGWFLDDDEGYANSRRKVALLNSFGREGFYRGLFEGEADHGQ